MHTFRPIAIALSLSVLGPCIGLSLAENATIQTFTNSVIEQVDPGTKKLTFKTVEGQSWSLDVNNADLLKGLEKGDRVSLELDSEDRIKNVVRGEANGEKNAPTKQIERTPTE
jgi:hypothetical protein